MLGIVLLWIVVYLSGMLFCKIVGEKETSQLWKHLIGFFFLIFCQGVVFSLGQLGGWSFRNAVSVLATFLFFVCLVALLVCKKELIFLWKKWKAFSLKKTPYVRYMMLLLWLFLGIIFVVSFGTASNRNDAMVETVQRTLLTDTMNQYHPFTGQPMELGMIMSRKIMTLPFWYAALSIVTGFSGVSTVWILGTLLTITFSLVAFAELGGLLFFRDFKKTWLLIIFLELLYLSGDYYFCSTGYQVLFYGYSGEVIVGVVTLPCVLSMLYRFVGSRLRHDFPEEKESLRFRSVIPELVLVLGSCIFLTSFVWGVAVVILAICMFAISCIGVRLTKRISRKGETS